MTTQDRTSCGQSWSPSSRPSGNAVSILLEFEACSAIRPPEGPTKCLESPLTMAASFNPSGGRNAEAMLLARVEQY